MQTLILAKPCGSRLSLSTHCRCILIRGFRLAVTITSVECSLCLGDAGLRCGIRCLHTQCEGESATIKLTVISSKGVPSILFASYWQSSRSYHKRQSSCLGTLKAYRVRSQLKFAYDPSLKAAWSARSRLEWALLSYSCCLMWFHVANRDQFSYNNDLGACRGMWFVVSVLDARISSTLAASTGAMWVQTWELVGVSFPSTSTRPSLGCYWLP